MGIADTERQRPALGLMFCFFLLNAMPGTTQRGSSPLPRVGFFNDPGSPTPQSWHWSPGDEGGHRGFAGILAQPSQGQPVPLLAKGYV